MTLILLLTAFAGLTLGYVLALALSRSRVKLARNEVEADFRSQLAIAQAQIVHMEVDLRAQAERVRESESALDASRRELGLAREENARTVATLEARDQERETLVAAGRQQDLDLRTLRDDLLAKSKAVATLESQIEGLQQTAAARLDALSEAQAKLAETFRSLSSEALQANNASFLQLAQTQMDGRQAQAAQDLDARQQAIAGLMQPVQTGLAAMQDQVQSLAKERARAEATLGTQIESLVLAQTGLQTETGKLATALRKPEVKGKWGEVQLRNVVEYAGMTEHVDFELQNSYEVEDGKHRPDLLVRLPGSKRIAIDAKAPLRAYLEALEVEGPAREDRLDAVASQVRTQVTSLGDKRYFDGLPDSPDFVVLFLPLESLFSMALQRDSKLLDYALEQHVILASPTTLVTLLKSAAYGWAQERIQANAEEIQKLGTELLDRVTQMATHTDALRKSLLASVEAFNRFAGSLESRVMVTAQKLHVLGIRPVSKRKTRILGLKATQSIHADLSGLPKLGVQGEAPTLDVEAIEHEGDNDFEGEVGGEDLTS